MASVLEWENYSFSTTEQADSRWYKLAEMIALKQHRYREQMLHWWDMEMWFEYNYRLRRYFEWIE